MNVTLDDDTARMAADLRLKFREAIAKEIIGYFGEPDKINWGSVVLGLMTVAADTNNKIQLDKNEAINFFKQFTDGKHFRGDDDVTH